MLHLSLLPSLVLPALAVLAPSQDDLSRALPRDAVAVVLFGDLGALCGEDAGSWGRMLSDPRWVDVFVALAEAGEAEDTTSIVEFAGALGALSRGVHGGALAFPELQSPRALGVLLTDEGWCEQLRARIADGGGAPEALECAGGEGFAITNPDSQVAVIVQRGPRVFFALEGDLDEARAGIGALVERLAYGGGDEARGWWLQRDGRASGAHVELFMDLATIVPNDPELADVAQVFGALEAIYTAATFGAGVEAEMVFALDYAGAPVIEQVAEALVPADAALLGLAPEGWNPFVVGLDFERVVSAALALASESFPDVEEQYEAGLEAIDGLLGINVEEELFENFTGQVLLLQQALDLGTALTMDEEDPPIDLLMPTFGFAVHDHDPLLDAAETLMDMAESQGAPIFAAEVSGGSLWTIDTGEGFTLALGIGSGFLAFGLEGGVAELLGTASDLNAPRALTADGVAALCSELDGAFVTASTFEAMHAAFAGAGETLAALAETGELEVPERAAEAVDAVTELLREHLSGTVGGDAALTARRLSYRLLCR